MNTRFLAAKVIADVLNGSSLSDKLSEHTINKKDAAFVHALCYGVCRYYSRLSAILRRLLKKPLKRKDNLIYALLLIGLQQLIYMRVSTHAAVAETVNAAKAMNQSWASGLVNAILREYLRRKDEIDVAIQMEQEAVFSHPQWWINKIKKDWPEHWQSILDANNEPPPFALRVNQQKLSRENYLNKIPARIISQTHSGIIADQPIPVAELPGFAQGEVSVQDGAAQLAAELLQLKPNLHVLDACAAPGGKLNHILEIEPELKVIAVEKDAQRILKMEENLKRLHQQAECICADVVETKNFGDSQYFDRILLDAPCSASGVIRRHPDIKLLRQPKDIAVLAQQQLHLLHALWPRLKPDGLLLYVTCSIFSEENSEVIKKFLTENADADEEKIQASWGLACAVGRQILPGMHDMDGFYYALLRKRRNYRSER